ncbi:MAG TPA: 50S ribosomal protein L5 [Candidatus Deferrimicrobium sp.]|nr:50S ribosomal protein L5 [Candidatus Deferrimicrobium sp.]
MDEEKVIYFTPEQKTEILESWKKYPMKQLKIKKVTVHMGVGASGERLEKAISVLESLTNQTPVKLLAKKTIRDFGIRKREPITAKVTLRGIKAMEFLKRALSVVENKLKYSSIDEYGNISFGIKEHIEMPDTAYEPALGIFGLDITINVEHPGFRIARRRKYKCKVPKQHRVDKLETMILLNTQFNVEIIKEYVISYY